MLSNADSKQTDSVGLELCIYKDVFIWRNMSLDNIWFGLFLIHNDGYSNEALRDINFILFPYREET